MAASFRKAITSCIASTQRQAERVNTTGPRHRGHFQFQSHSFSTSLPFASRGALSRQDWKHFQAHGAHKRWSLPGSTVGGRFVLARVHEGISSLILTSPDFLRPEKKRFPSSRGKVERRRLGSLPVIDVVESSCYRYHCLNASNVIWQKC